MHAKKILISNDHLIHPTVPTPDPDSLAISPCRKALLHPSLAQVPVKLLVDLGDLFAPTNFHLLTYALGEKNGFNLSQKKKKEKTQTSS